MSLFKKDKSETEKKKSQTYSYVINLGEDIGIQSHSNTEKECEQLIKKIKNSKGKFISHKNWLINKDHFKMMIIKEEK